MFIMYRLKLIFDNPDTFALFPVSKGIAHQVRRALLAEYPVRAGADFIVFPTLNGRTVVLRTGAVSLCNVLVDPVWPLEQAQTPCGDDEREDDDDAADEDGDWAVRIRINGSPKAFETDAAEGSELATLIGAVEHSAEGETRCLSFTDGDGEELIVNLMRIAYIEVPTAQLEEQIAQ